MIPRLVLLTDRSQLSLGRGLVGTVRECVDAGLEMVVVREHDLGLERRHALIYALAGIRGLTVLSSRVPDSAAHGVHLACATCNAELVDPVRSHEGAEVSLTPRHLRGRSCHTVAEVQAAAREGMDYVTLSPYAETASKPGYGPPLAADAFGEDHAIPVLALGGIDETNAAAAMRAGADGVAVMGAVMRADRPAELVAQLLREVQG